MKLLVVIFGAVMLVGTSVYTFWQFNKGYEMTNAGGARQTGKSVLADPLSLGAIAAQHVGLKAAPAKDRADGVKKPSEKDRLIAALSPPVSLQKTSEQQREADRKLVVSIAQKVEKAASKSAETAALKPVGKEGSMGDVKAVQSQSRVIAVKTKTARRTPRAAREIKKNIAYKAVRARPRSVALQRKEKQPVAIVSRTTRKVLPVGQPAKQQQMALLTKKERRNLGQLVSQKKLPAINLVVAFDYKSSSLSRQAQPILDRIGEVLTDGKLVNSVFVIAGHTDAVGGKGYNRGLSAQRANTVKAYLREHFNIDDKRLVTVGYGEERLKNRDNPEAAENRRVEFINLLQRTSQK